MDKKAALDGEDQSDEPDQTTLRLHAECSRLLEPIGPREGSPRYRS